MVITQIIPLEHSKGKVRVSFDCADDLILYRGELRGLGLKEQMQVNNELYEKMYHEIVGKRAVKRAMHLLEKMDRTQEQLRKKLSECGYPQELVEEAIAYVKSYRYIDDERYAKTYVRLNQEKKSAGRMKMDLLAKGVAQEVIARALAEENETAPETLIQRLLEKKKFDPAAATPKETAKMYQFLLRRGFSGNEIMHVLKDNLDDSADVCHF
ncbi:MAG: recombination regulator RecX [Acetatifactor sp.]|nr:recombination regulator RecX [Acetatifactor sp.]